MSNVNASGTSDESAGTPNFVTYSVQPNSSAAMEPGFDSSAGTYMQHGSSLLAGFSCIEMFCELLESILYSLMLLFYISLYFYLFLRIDILFLPRDA